MLIKNTIAFEAMVLVYGRGSRKSFYLDIKIANKSGGSGAIEKPVLFFKLHKKYFWSNSEYIEFYPITKKHITTRISDSSTETEIVSLGKSYNLKGGEIIDDELRYYIDSDSEAIKKLIKNYKNGSFYIRYVTNSGAKHEVKMTLTLE